MPSVLGCLWLGCWQPPLGAAGSPWGSYSEVVRPGQQSLGEGQKHSTAGPGPWDQHHSCSLFSGWVPLAAPGLRLQLTQP